MQKCNYNSGSNFDRQGQRVIAKYLDSSFVTGVVVESRVKYGGTTQHSILSDSPTVITYNQEIRPIGSIFLVDENQVTHCEI